MTWKHTKKTKCKYECDENMDDGIAKGFFSTHVTLVIQDWFSVGLSINYETQCSKLIRFA